MKKLISLLLVLTIGVFASQAFGQQTNKQKEGKGEMSNNGKATGKDNYGQQVKSTSMEKKDTIKKNIEKPVKDKEVKK